MSKITINGNVYMVPDGASISVHNNDIRVNGKPIEQRLTGIVKVVWEGPVGNLTSDCAVECGDVQGNVTAGGSVACANVQGDVDAKGSVSCDKVGRDVSAGGSVSCDDVQGSVRAGGSILRK